MESRAFIRAANTLAKQVRDYRTKEVVLGSNGQQRQALQKEINSLFSALQNPTLLAAANLRDVAIDADFRINPAVMTRLRQGEQMW
jgi:hypothetical protein